MAIIAHCRDGGRVVVGVRPPNDSRFRMLGELRSVDDLQGARFLVESGDDVLREQGTNTFHKAITVQCLNDGLRRGVGLAVARHPINTEAAKWCKACCYLPPRVVLNFAELHAEGVEAFQLSRKRKREPGVKIEVKTEPDEGKTHTKRLRFKQPPIKIEPEDGSSEPASASALPLPSVLKVKTEPEELEEPHQDSHQLIGVVQDAHMDEAEKKEEEPDTEKDRDKAQEELRNKDEGEQTQLVDDGTFGMDFVDARIPNVPVEVVRVKEEIKEETMGGSTPGVAAAGPLA